MKPYCEDSHVTVYNSDALTALRGMPSESVDMCMTSPPYWMQRNYHIDGQLGLEKTFIEYIDKLMTIFDEVKRILKRSGTCFVNIDDSYSGMKVGNTETIKNPNVVANDFVKPKQNIPTKSLIGIPERFAIAMTDRGWIRRNTIIFYKPNAMPESAKDRFTNDFEYLYFFSKSSKYYFEQQFDESTSRFGIGIIEAKQKYSWNTGNRSHSGWIGGDGQRRNKRCVWEIATEPSGEEHYAAYPEKLCETPMLAGCPSAICTKCGKPREKIYERKRLTRPELPQNDPRYRPNTYNGSYGDINGKGDAGYTEHREIGLTDCGCGAEFIPGTVLDPFAGIGTTGCVAKRLGRRSILIEISPQYCEIIKKRVSNIPIPMEL